MTRHLRQGYTTGACAAAAAGGAALMLARQETVGRITIPLPAGESALFTLQGQTVSAGEASCFVIKDAGDDPDVTNGVEVHARVTLLSSPGNSRGSGELLIVGGAGIGRATKPGLAVSPGEWAINPVPRQMIAAAVRAACSDRALRVEISIPDGELRARKTLNARLGIIGGLSILGTTGIVRPISAKAWTDTLDAALDVARACDSPTVVLSTGRSSELAAQRFLAERTDEGRLAEEAYIMMGDHVGYALRACQQRGFLQPMIACQFAKLLKIACGYENTHAAAADLELAHLHRWAEQGGLGPDLLHLIDGANTAREVIVASRFDPPLLRLVTEQARQAVRQHAPQLSPSFLVADYAQGIAFSST